MNVTVLVILATLSVRAVGGTEPADTPTLGSLPGDVGKSFSRLFSWELLPQSLAIAGASGVSAALDDEVNDYFARADRLGTAGDIGSHAGVLAGGFGAVLVTGWLSDDPRHRAMSYDLMQGLLVANGVAFAIKLSARRERPDGGPRSFPSGHAANSFTVAGVLSHHYGWKVGIPLHAFAALVSLSRLDKQSHWLSDSVAGAGLGLLVAHAVVRKAELPSPSPNLSWRPVFPAGGLGVRFAWHWGGHRP